MWSGSPPACKKSVLKLTRIQAILIINKKTFNWTNSGLNRLSFEICHTLTYVCTVAGFVYSTYTKAVSWHSCVKCGMCGMALRERRLFISALWFSTFGFAPAGNTEGELRSDDSMWFGRVTGYPLRGRGGVCVCVWGSLTAPKVIHHGLLWCFTVHSISPVKIPQVHLAWEIYYIPYAFNVRGNIHRMYFSWKINCCLIYIIKGTFVQGNTF